MTGYLLLGVGLGGLVFVLLLWVRHRKVCHAEEEKQLRLQRKKRADCGLREMVEALTENLGRDDRYHCITHAAIRCTGALSACFFELTETNKLQGVVVDGLFPPQRKFPQNQTGAFSGRAAFIEQVLRSECLSFDESLIAEVAAKRRGELIKECSRDPRIPVHADSALKLRTMMAVPILFQERLLGVLAVANSVEERSFAEEDLSSLESVAEKAGPLIQSR